MRALIVGAGPIGCLLAVKLRQRGSQVAVYEKGCNPRLKQPVPSPSFNLTLSLRGLKALDLKMVERLHAESVRMSDRVIHCADGSVLCQPYGVSSEHYLLSIERRALHSYFLEEAERSGAQLYFQHECISVDCSGPSAVFVYGNIVHEAFGDILIGCDGANSVVRRDMAQMAQTIISQMRSSLGYIELKISARTTGVHPLAAAGRTANPAGMDEGFHIWPRHEFMLIAQPNVDRSYTATLFLPFTSSGTEDASFARLDTSEKVIAFFHRYFPDLVAFAPRLAQEFYAKPPASLRAVQCDSFHYDRLVLMGDAAHTMLPFYGQGINCGFEDARVFLNLLDVHMGQKDPVDAIRRTLREFTAARRLACKAITELSEANAVELRKDTADLKFHARATIERELYRRRPEQFEPLYCGVAFSTLPYDEVIRRYLRRRRLLDLLCETHNVQSQADEIIAAYEAAYEENASVQKGDREPEYGLDLPPAEQKHLLDLAVSCILRHQRDLNSGNFPASYVHDSINVSAYEDGKRLSAELREDKIPVCGERPQTLLSQIFDRAIVGGTIHPHPGFMAHIPSGGLLQGAVGSFIAKALNRFPGIWVAAPGLNQIECNVIRWFCTMLGYDQHAFGYLTTSGSVANMMGLMCACYHARGAPAERQVFYTSEQAHFSIHKAARLVGIPADRMRVIATRRDYTMDVDEQVKSIQADLAGGLFPACVIATAGTTNTGAIDDLPRLASICKKYGIWLHVDACFGGFFRITARGRAVLEGIEQADSIAVDPHKSLFLPHGNSALLAKEREKLFATFRTPGAAYLPGSPLEPELTDFSNYGLELSREVRGLTAWLPIKMHGIMAFEQCLDEKLDLAQYLAGELRKLPSIEVCTPHPLHLPVVTFRLHPRFGLDHTGLNEKLCELICSRGNVYVTTTKLPHENVVVRACILHHRTRQQSVDELVADVRAAIPSLLKDLPLVQKFTN